MDHSDRGVYMTGGSDACRFQCPAWAAKQPIKGVCVVDYGTPSKVRVLVVPHLMDELYLTRCMLGFGYQGHKDS